MILSEIEYKIFLEKNANSPLALLVGSMPEVGSVLKYTRADCLIINLNRISDPIRFSRILRKRSSKNMSVYHNDSLSDELLLHRAGQDAVVSVSAPIKRSKLYKRLLSQEDLYALGKYVEALKNQSRKYDHKSILEYLDTDCSSLDIEEYIQSTQGKASAEKVVNINAARARGGVKIPL